MVQYTAPNMYIHGVNKQKMNHCEKKKVFKIFLRTSKRSTIYLPVNADIRNKENICGLVDRGEYNIGRIVLLVYFIN